MHKSEKAKFQVKLAIWMLGGKCVVCGSKKNLTFNHIVPELKTGNVSDLRYRPRRFWREVLICELVCFKCHMNLHQGEKSPYYPKIDTDWKKKLYSLRDTGSHLRVG